MASNPSASVPIEDLRSIGIDALTAARQRLDLQAAILENLPDAQVVTDETGTIVLVNSQTELMFGYHRSEMVGQKIEILLPEEVRERHTSHRSGYNDEPRTRSMGANLLLSGRRKSGKEFPVEIMLAPVVTASGAYTIAIIRRRKMSSGLSDR
jgi:protein-histidine pros-kinase